MNKKTSFQKNRDEIFYHVVNSLLAGGLVMVGSFADGEITTNSFLIAGLASLAVMLTKFRDYWVSQEGEYKSSKVFHFIH